MSHSPVLFLNVWILAAAAHLCIARVHKLCSIVLQLVATYCFKLSMLCLDVRRLLMPACIVFHPEYHLSNAEVH